MASRRICSSEENLVENLCLKIKDTINSSILKRNICTIGLSGGSLGKYLSQGLPALPDIKWNLVHFFFCDERHVPITDNDSTYKYYADNLFPKLGIPTENIHCTNTNLTVVDAAVEYEKTIKQFFSQLKDQDGDHIPVFDLLLLGMGPDGHTCSLFPNHPLLKDTNRLVAPISDSPKPPPLRVTFTFVLVNHCSSAIFACAGEGKAEMVKKILEAPYPSEELPATMVKPKELIWFLDESAAKLLQS